mmetsp:Transcript_2015/g.2537  ORF Transcript_2015/g.2537 Transcript_2015/m.2537 type:complete len:423 (-) Transcript_2015:233-1501(-)
MIQIIKEMGGIPFVKTNTPQLNMLPESCNNIIGYTNNPYNIDRSAGGSSGGEGSIIGTKSSILGIGTDIGGSIRIPSHYCGIIGYKPSSKRCIQIGKRNASGPYSNKYVKSSSGPMGRYMDDIVLFLRNVMWSQRAFELDVCLTPIPFRDNIYNDKRKLNIGYWFDDGWMVSTDTVKRGIQKCVDILKNEYGYNIVKIPFNDGRKVFEFYMKHMGAEGNFRDYKRALKGEPLYKGYNVLKYINALPLWIKKILSHVLYKLKSYRKAFAVRLIGRNGLSIKEYRDVHKNIDAYRHEFWDEISKYSDKKIDVIITPVCFWPTLPHDNSKDFIPFLTATFLQNLLDVPGGSFGPVAYVNDNECKYDVSDMDKYYSDDTSELLNQYMKNAKGLPVNVQIFGRMFDDEIVLRVMKDLETSLKNVDNP